MFTVLYENQYRKQFCSDFYFESLDDAKKSLKLEGYTENNRIFYRADSKAYIQPLKNFNS